MCPAIAHVAEQEREREELLLSESQAADHNLISQVTLKCLLACLCRMDPHMLSARETRHRRSAIKMHSRGEYICAGVTQGVQMPKHHCETSYTSNRSDKEIIRYYRLPVSVTSPSIKLDSCCKNDLMNMLRGISELAILRNREKLMGLVGMFLRECFYQDEFKAQHSR